MSACAKRPPCSTKLIHRRRRPRPQAQRRETTPRLRINSALLSRRPGPPLNSTGGAPPRIWTFFSRLSGGYFAAANLPGSLPRIRSVHEEALGHEVLLRVAPILTGPLAIALELPLQRGHDPVEGEAGCGRHVLDVDGGTIGNVKVHRAAQGQASLGTVIVEEGHASADGGGLDRLERRADEPAHAPPQHRISLQPLDVDLHGFPPRETPASDRARSARDSGTPPPREMRRCRERAGRGPCVRA